MEVAELDTTERLSIYLTKKDMKNDYLQFPYFHLKGNFQHT